MTGTNLPRVPEGLRDLMKVFTKDVLRERPENLYEYSANYFDGIVSEKIPQPMRKYEPVQNYEAILKNRIRQQVPLSLVFNIIPETLTELIKQFIKAVLRENPENIYVFAKEYFHQLSISKTTQNKTTKYSTYDKYLEGRENVRHAPKLTCECGRVLSTGTPTQEVSLKEQNVKTNASIIDKDNEHDHSHNDNYLRAVCIIQKHVRQYLKRKRAKNIHNNHEYINAIYVIQRHFRRYLTKKRIAKQNSNQHYDSVTYMRAVYVIQRHYRLYRKRQQKQKQLKKIDGVSLSAAAFIIQRTFRRLIRARRAKKHIPAALDQGDDLNDNASEAGSYTSASTALLSTESAGEHMEFGGNYDESVHQQTIKEDEEVENNYVNFDEKHFQETIKNEAQSINSKMWDSSMEITGNEEDIEKTKLDIKSLNEFISKENGKAEIEGSNTEIKLEAKDIPSEKEKSKLKTPSASLEEQKLSANDSEILSMNNLNKKQSNDEPMQHSNKSSAEQDIQKAEDSELQNTQIISKGVSSADERKKAMGDSQTAESVEKPADKNNINDSNIVAIEKEIIEPTIVKVDAIANESIQIKSEIKDQKKEDEAESTAEKVFSNAEKSENNDEKCIIEKVQKDVKEEEMAVASSIEENKVKRSENNDQEVREVDKTIANKVEEKESNNNEHLTNEKVENTESEVSEPADKIERSGINNDKTVSEKTVNGADESTPVESTEETQKSQIVKREIHSIEPKNGTGKKGEDDEPNISKPVINDTETESTDIQPEILKEENEVAEKSNDEATLANLEIKIDAPTDDEIENELKQPKTEKSEIKDDVIKTTEVQPEVKEKENGIDIPTTVEMQEKVEKSEEEVDEPTILKEKVNQNEAANVKVGNDIEESTDLKLENETDELSVVKMGNIVEDAILAKVAINKMSHKNDEGNFDEILNIQKEVDEPTIDKMEVEANEKSITSVGNDGTEFVDLRMETEGAETSEPREIIEKDLAVDEKIIEDLEGGKDLPTEKLEDNSIETTIVKIESTSNGSTNVKPEGETDAAEVEEIKDDKPTIYAKENKSDESIITGKKINSDEANNNKTENKSDKTGIKENENLFDESKEDPETTNVKNEKDANLLSNQIEENAVISPDIERTDSQENEPIILKLQNEVDEPAIIKIDDGETIAEVKEEFSKPAIIEVERESHEKIADLPNDEDTKEVQPLPIEDQKDPSDRGAIKPTKTESKEDDPSMEVMDELINKLHIVEAENELDQPSTEQNANEVNEPINEKIIIQADEPEVVKVENKDDQQTRVKIEHENGDSAKMEEPTVRQSESNVLTNKPTNEPTNELTDEPIKEKIENELKESVEKLEDSVKKEVHEDKDSTILKIESNANEPAIENKDESEVREPLALDNESNSIITKTDSEPIAQSVDDEIPKDPKPDMSESNDGESHVIDKRNADITKSSIELPEAQSADVAADVDTKVEKDSSLLKSNKLIGTQNFTNTTTNEIDSNTKKLPKEKHIGSSLESGRLIPTPIAELQLKSFKPPPGLAPWYEPFAEYTNPEEDQNQKQEINVKTKIDETKSNEEAQDQSRLSNTALERVPKYFNGEESTPTKDPKIKNSISFFISFDSDDEKQTFKVPKKFLNKPKPDIKRSSASKPTEDIKDDQLEAENYPEVDNDELEIDIPENDYQQFPKLQTIPEVNESDSSNDLRYGNKTVDQDSAQTLREIEEIVDFLTSDFPETETLEVRESTLSEAPSVNDDDINKDTDSSEPKASKVKESTLSTVPSVNNQNLNNDDHIITNKDDEKISSDNDKHNAAVIIQNCVRAFLKNKKISNDAKLQFRRSIAAKKIQRAYREYSKRNVSEKQIKEDKSNAEKMAALIIQRAFRSYSERRKLENFENSTQGSVTSSPMTAIRNLSISSELTSIESTSTQDVMMPLSEDKDMDSVDGSKPITPITPTTPIRLIEANTDSNGIDSETIARNAETTNDTQVDRTHGLLESKFVPDTSNSIIDQNQTRSIEQNNAVSNDLAVSTDDAVFGAVEDPTIASFADSGNSIKGIAAIRELVNEFLNNEIQYSARDLSTLTEVEEEPCIKKTASITSLAEGLETNKSSETEQNEPSDVKEEQLTPGDSQDLDTFATDTLDRATLKLLKPEQTIEKMSQRQISETLDKGNLPIEASFEEPIIKSMGSLQDQLNTDIEDGDLIIYNRLQREDTRESSAQSESVVFGETNEDESENPRSAPKMDAENSRVQFTRHYTIAGDDPRRMFKSVTIDDTIRYAEDGEIDFDAAPLLDATNSFCLDDETSETIRKKIMAYSLSETDSDYFDPNKVITDDSYIDTAMADAMGTSTETESTIVSAATKIQAGARGFLTRRRIRRASAGTKSSTQATKASFGNDAISESLERFIEEEAAKKIQTAYRLHTRKQKRRKNKLEMVSLESSLAARRQKLQRGDALRNDSNPDDDNSARTSISVTGVQVEKVMKKHRSEAAVERRKTTTSMELKWPVVRQNSMPVQIDCEVLRVIPKHMRKRIKSAESQKKNRK